MTSFLSNDDLLSSWRVFDIMMNILMSGRTFWCHEIFLASWRIVWHNNKRVDIMMCLWHQDDFFYVTNLFTSWHKLHLLTSWRMFWRHELFESFVVMTYFWRHFFTYLLTYLHVFDVMTNILTSWRIFGFMANFFDVFLMSWQTFYVMTAFWRHDMFFDVMTNFLTPWRTFWRHYVFWGPWTFWRHDVLFDVMTSLSWVDNINIIHNQIHTNVSECWCGQTLLGRYHVCPKAYTQPFSPLGLYIDLIYLSEIISAIIKMHKYNMLL